MVLPVRSKKHSSSSSSPVASKRRSNSNSNSNSNINSHSGGGAIASVLHAGHHAFPFRNAIESRVQKAFPKVPLDEIPTLTSSLICFLELKVLLQEYSSDSNQHLLACSCILEEAWLALYGDCELYPQVIMAIQKFHGQPHCHVFLRRTSFLLTEEGTQNQEYLEKLVRTQSLMQCYYQTTMPTNLEELSNQARAANNKFKQQQRKQHKQHKNKKPEKTVKFQQDSTATTTPTAAVHHPVVVNPEPVIVIEEITPQQVEENNDIPPPTTITTTTTKEEMVVVPENDDANTLDSDDDDDSDSDDDSYTDASYSYYTEGETITNMTSNTEADDTLTYTSTLTPHSTATGHNINNINLCVFFSQLWKKSFPTNPSHTSKDHHNNKESTQPVDDITLSVSDSSSSEESPPKRGKKRYQKLEKRWEDNFQCYWV